MDLVSRLGKMRIVFRSSTIEGELTVVSRPKLRLHEPHESMVFKSGR